MYRWRNVPELDQMAPDLQIRMNDTSDHSQKQMLDYANPYAAQCHADVTHQTDSQTDKQHT